MEPQADFYTAGEPTTNPEHATNGNVEDGNVTTSDKPEGEAEEVPQGPESVFQLTIKLPHNPGETQLMVSTQEQVQDIRQSIVDQPHTFQYSCFHLEHKGKRINDFVELSEVPDIMEDPVCTLVEDPYTEAQARMHIVRVRELIGAAGDRTDLVLGIDAGTSLCDGVEITDSKDQKEETNPVTGYDLNAPGPISAMLAKLRDPAPKTIKSLSLSQWNPPPYDLRNRGHLLYLNVTTNEGEQFPVTSHVSGFYVNRSTNQKFDPAPRTAPKPFSAHSLISLIGKMSPSFDAAFSSLQEYNGQRDPLASYQLSNSIPAAPWLVKASSLQQHQPDLARSQEALLLSGADNMETLRDWNEEFQSTRELPKETVQDRVFRERLTSKLFAEYNEAAVRGACLVARGEVQPLNPTEERDAQIYVYNNVFYSFGADGAGTFTSDGGDEAARVAVGKDVQGVKNVNQMDIDGLCTPGTVVVDYLGKRIVGQSIVPGIFKQRDPGENQIDYGGVEGKDVIAEHDGFVKPFSELSKNMRVKKHAVWDKEGKKHDLEASVETKGLLGTDGRKYVLDLYRVTPLDISWLEQHRGDGQTDEKRYPHRMTVLRPELVDSYRITKLREYIAKQLEEKREAKKAEEGAEKKDEEAKDDEAKDEEAKDGETKDTEEKPKQQETVDVSGFTFTLNPDVFSGQIPQSEEEKASYQEDEADVRTVCEYLRSDVIPRFLRDLQEGETGFPMDGASLTSSLHKRGINVRYLGELARLAGEKEDNRMKALKQICEQEMVSRAFKHVANKQLRDLPPAFSQSCIAHLLNCLLGAEYNAEPQSEFDQDLKAIYPETDFSVEKITPQTLKDEIVRQVALRYRHDIEGDVVQSGKQLQMLREVSLKLGFQLEAKDYAFTKPAATEQSDLKEKSSSDSLKVPQTNGTKVNEGGNKKKNKKRNADHSPARPVAAAPAAPAVTFHPENVFNTVPIIKEASPRSILAEEALDAGRMSIQQDQKDLGQELLLESLSLHEQIYGILHPEVARVYYALSTIYYSLDEKAGAVELAKKAVIVSERTLGVDSTETILAYLNLSLFEHATGNTRNALALVRHALDLWKVVYGIKHPDSMTTINNAAVMLQTLKHFHDSRLWFEASLAICEEVAGKQSINTATLLFQLAQAHALDHDSKTAVAKMRESYNIFKAELGADNQNTKEAETWLETLTHSAVSQAKQAQQLLTNRKMLLRNSGRPGAPSSARTVMPQPPNGQSTRSMPEALQQATGRNDQKSVDELLKYINGEGAGKQSSKKKTTNPKKRQQQKA
jgi:protein TIF31